MCDLRRIFILDVKTLTYCPFLVHPYSLDLQVSYVVLLKFLAFQLYHKVLPIDYQHSLYTGNEVTTVFKHSQVWYSILDFYVWGKSEISSTVLVIVLLGKGKPFCTFSSRRRVNLGNVQKGIGWTGVTNGRRILFPKYQEILTVLHRKPWGGTFRKMSLLAIAAKEGCRSLSHYWTFWNFHWHSWSLFCAIVHNFFADTAAAVLIAPRIRIKGLLLFYHLLFIQHISLEESNKNPDY